MVKVVVIGKTHRSEFNHHIDLFACLQTVHLNLSLFRDSCVLFHLLLAESSVSKVTAKQYIFRYSSVFCYILIVINQYLYWLTDGLH